MLQIDYSEVDEKRLASAQPRLREGLFKTVVTAAEQIVDKETNDLAVRLTLAPLDASDNPKSPTVRYFVPVPISNPEVANHAPTDVDSQKKKLRKFISAVSPGELPAFPRKGPDGKYRTEDGELMTKAAWDSLNTVTSKKSLDKAKRWFNDPNTLIGEVFYTAIKENGERSNIFYVTADPDGKEVTTEGFAA